MLPSYVRATTDCYDVLLIFARGSGQNSGEEYISSTLDEKTFGRVEKESYTFFKNHADNFNNYFPNISFKAVSVHDFPGKYDPIGYKAVPVGWDTPEKLTNSANADVSWIPGDYQASVQHGITETVGYIKDQIAQCPNQYFIVGGYSQGAQVVGESLFQLSNKERSKILGVGLFGDPKYIGAKDGISYPWRRGQATNKDTGMLDPRIPYVPQGMERRTLSWCNRNDIVCAGLSALRKSSSHSAYSENSIGYAVKELISIATPQLTALDRSPDGTGVPPVQVSPDDMQRNRDVMFLFNDNSNVDVIRTLKGVDPMLPQFVHSFDGLTRFAAKSFGEHDYGSFYAPRVDNIQAFLPLNGYDPSRPIFTSSNLSTAVYNKYGSLDFIIGGGDIADPHQLGLERAIASSGWSTDPNVERNIVLITDRPPKDPYEYNICNSTVRQWLHFPDIDGYKNCFTNYQRETWQKVLEPETCEKISMVILEDTCTNPLMAASYLQMNKRSLSDEIKLAQAYHVKISVVIPHKFLPGTGNNLFDTKVRDQLRYVAEATGGKYIYYDNASQYNSTLLYDTLWQVFTKKPQSIDVFADGASDQQVLGLHSNTPVVLDVSRNGVVADTYKWDFDDNGTWDEITPGPVTEHQFIQPAQGLFRVQAVNTNGDVLSETRKIYIVTAGDNQGSEPPATPENVTATQQADGTILINWSADNTDNVVVVSDPATSLPVGSTTQSAGSLTLPGGYENLVIRVTGEHGTSQPLLIPVSVYIAPVPIVADEDTSVNTNNENMPPQQIDPPPEEPLLIVQEPISPITVEQLVLQEPPQTLPPQVQYPEPLPETPDTVTIPAQGEGDLVVNSSAEQNQNEIVTESDKEQRSTLHQQPANKAIARTTPFNNAVSTSIPNPQVAGVSTRNPEITTRPKLISKPTFRQGTHEQLIVLILALAIILGYYIYRKKRSLN